jgi:secreted trypsin-like serine protease
MPVRRRLLLALLAVAQITAAGCQIDEPAIGRSLDPIINGSIDNAPAHDAVVALADSNGDPFCTGTYVGNQTIVTAAHCFDEGLRPSFVYVGVHAIADNEACLAGVEAACNRFFFVEQMAVHPSYAAAAFDAGYDIAMVTVGGELPGVRPIPFLAMSEGT